jgi:hypothetical protein
MRSSRSSRYTIGSKLLAPLLVDHCRSVTVDWSPLDDHCWLVTGWSLLVVAPLLFSLHCCRSAVVAPLLSSLRCLRSVVVFAPLLSPLASLRSVRPTVFFTLLLSSSLRCCRSAVVFAPLSFFTPLLSLRCLLHLCLLRSAVFFTPLLSHSCCLLFCRRPWRRRPFHLLCGNWLSPSSIGLACCRPRQQ